MSSTAAVLLLEELEELGLKIEARGDCLVVRPATGVTPELADHLREHKLEVLALLAQGQQAGDPAGSFPARWDEVVWHPPFWRCYCCGTRRRWRLAEGSEWVCGRCHAPEPSYQIVWDGEGVQLG